MYDLVGGYPTWPYGEANPKPLDCCPSAVANLTCHETAMVVQNTGKIQTRLGVVGFLKFPVVFLLR